MDTLCGTINCKQNKYKLCKTELCDCLYGYKNKITIQFNYKYIFKYYFL